MAVSITRSIAEGFRAANKSWAGIGARIPFVVLGMLGKIAGGSMQGAALLISGVGSVIAGTYLSFASLAAFIRFYEDTKAATP